MTVNEQEPRTRVSVHNDNLSGNAGGVHTDSLGSLAKLMGIRLERAEPKTTVLSMPVAGNTQPLGLLHGGASAVLAETAGSLAANLNAPVGYVAVGTELSISHHRATGDGCVVATATALHIGASQATFDIKIRDNQERLVATARLTCMFIKPRQ